MRHSDTLRKWQY